MGVDAACTGAAAAVGKELLAIENTQRGATSRCHAAHVPWALWRHACWRWWHGPGAVCCTRTQPPAGPCAPAACSRVRPVTSTDKRGATLLGHLLRAAPPLASPRRLAHRQLTRATTLNLAVPSSAATQSCEHRVAGQPAHHTADSVAKCQVIKMIINVVVKQGRQAWFAQGHTDRPELPYGLPAISPYIYRTAPR